MFHALITVRQKILPVAPVQHCHGDIFTIDEKLETFEGHFGARAKHGSIFLIFVDRVVLPVCTKNS